MENNSPETNPEVTTDPVIPSIDKAIEAPEVVNDPPKADPPVIEPPKPRNRISKTITFSPEEFEPLDIIFAARKLSGISSDYNHMIRQMMDFCLNAGNGAVFATPAGVKVDFKNAFINPAE